MGRANGYPAHAPEGAGRDGGDPDKPMRPSCLEKAQPYRTAGRTETDTGGRVQTYQGAREKPR